MSVDSNVPTPTNSAPTEPTAPANSTPAAPAAPAAPVAPTPTPTYPAPDEWNDSTYEKYVSKYKGDAKEIAKAHFNSSQEFHKLQKTSKDLQSQFDDYKKSKEASPDFRRLKDGVYRDVLQTGKISDDNAQLFAQMGFDSEDLPVFKEAYENVINTRKSIAQKQIPNTPIDSVLKFIETEGNYTDKELALFQESSSLDIWGWLKDVETKMKSSKVSTVTHGSTPTSTSTDSYSSPADYRTDKSSKKYAEDPDFRKSVDAKFLRSGKNMTREWMMSAMLHR